MLPANIHEPVFLKTAKPETEQASLTLKDDRPPLNQFSGQFRTKPAHSVQNQSDQLVQLVML